MADSNYFLFCWFNSTLKVQDSEKKTSLAEKVPNEIVDFLGKNVSSPTLIKSVFTQSDQTYVTIKKSGSLWINRSQFKKSGNK